MITAAGALLLASSVAAGNTLPDAVEAAYWDCEFAAAQGRISLDEGAACHEIYEQLKRNKFDGKFERFLAWWRENKEREMASRAGRQRDD